MSAMRQRLHPWWFMALDRYWPGSRLLLGVVIFVIVGGALSLLFGLWSAESPDRRFRFELGLCLFFAFINAYGLTSTIAVIRRMQQALDELRPELRLDDEAFEHTKALLGAAPARVLLVVTVIGLGAGLVHSLLLFHFTGQPAGMDTAQFIASEFGTFFTWMVMVHVIAALIRNAHLFARIGRHHTTVDVLRSEPLTPFGTAAWLPATALMGTQIAYPLLSLGGFNAAATLPGFLLTFVTVLYLLIRPMWPVHVHLREARESLLKSIDAQIRAWRETNPDRLPENQHLQELTGLLQFKSQALALAEWPFNPGLAVRWLFYVVIPPMTWILAALAENVVDVWLG